MAQYFQVIEQLEKPFYAMVERGLVISGRPQMVQAKMRKIELVLSGRCRHRFKGEESQVLAAGDALIVPYRAEQIYEPLSPRESGHLLAIVISFDEAYLPFKQQTETPRLSPAVNDAVEFVEKYFPENRRLSQVMDAVLMETLSQMRQEAELHLPGFRWRVSGLCNSVVVQLARNMEQDRPAKQLPKENRGVYLVSCAKEYLLEHLTDEVRLDNLAEYLQVSREHLSRTFRRVAGQSLFSYFQHLRLERAKLILLNSDKNVTEIADECGFSSVALFCRNFKQYTQMTPLDYRDKFGSGE
jgi:AraC-like DNA-binding protein